MKRLLAGIFAASLASSAMAGVGFEFGAQFYYPRLDPEQSGEHWTGQGQSFAVQWGLDGGLALGAYTESTGLSDGRGNSYTFTAQAISIAKEVVKNGEVGVRIGSFFESYDSYPGLLTDIYGAVTLISGTGDKVTGKVRALAGGRFADSTIGSGGGGNGEDLSGFFVTMAVSLSL